MSHRVLLCGAWDEGAGYPRTRSLRLGFEAAGADVATCRVAGLGRDKQRMVRAPWRWPALWMRQQAQRRELLSALEVELAAHSPQLVVVPYPGHGLVRAVRDHVGDVPVVLDLFLSAYDTMIEDRRLARPGSLLARYAAQLDAKACAAADLVLLDTPENAAYVQQLTGLPAERFAWLPVHDPDAPTRAHEFAPPAADDCVRLLFFGTGVPLHGLDTLIRAVRHVPAIELTIVGGAMRDRQLAQRELGERCRLEPSFVARDHLDQLLRACHVVAGVFGRGGKAQRVVPFKVVHALAAGRGVVSAATPALARWLDGSGCIATAPADDVGALVARLRALVGDRTAIAAAAAAARPAYDRHFGTAALARRCCDVLHRVAPQTAVGAA